MKPRPRPTRRRSHDQIFTANYRRKSHDDLGVTGGVQSQAQKLARVHLEPNETLVGDFCDPDTSAADPDRYVRPQFLALLDAVRQGTVNRIRVTNFDRLYRHRSDLDKLTDLARTYGLELKSVNSGDLDLTTSTGRLQANLLCDVNTHEVEKGSERQYDSQDARAERGEPANSQRAFGYRRGGVDVVEAEAVQIRQGVAAVLTGCTWTGLALQWNRTGLPPVMCECFHADVLHEGACTGLNRKPVGTCPCTGLRSKPWTAVTVKQLILRPRNAGLRQHRGQIVGTGNWHGIITRATYEKLIIVTSARAATTAKPAGFNARKHLLSGLMVCGIEGCGRPMRATQAAGRAYYACKPAAGQDNRDRVPGRHVSIRVEEADETVHQFIVAFFRQFGVSPIDNDDNDGRFIQAVSDLDSVRASIDENDRRYYSREDSSFTIERYGKVDRMLAEQLTGLEAELASLNHDMTTGVMSGITPDRVSEVWGSLALVQQREVLRDFTITGMKSRDQRVVVERC